MSTIAREFTKEQLQQIIETDHVQCGEASALARIAMASLEAEAVCVIDQSNLDYLKSGSDADVWPASRTEMGDVLLYRAAPPAPVSVPAAMEMDDDFDSAFEHGKAVGWNAYRAAMLQGAEPVTTAYKLPPHIFRELVNRLRDTAVKYQGCQQLREQLSSTLQEVIQPAAPQQEVTQALAKGMERYGDAMQKLADSGD